jgi:hypothetical protein
VPNLLHCKMTIVNELSSIASINGKFKTIFNESGYADFIF